MGLFKKVVKRVTGKAWYDDDPSVQSGGMELLGRMFGTSYGTTGMLEQYEKSLYVFACISKIAEKVASIDFDLFQIMNSRGDTKEVPMHPALDLIYKVNPFQTKNEFFKVTVINLKAAGDAFWFKVRNDSGQVMELWNLRPDFVEIVKDPELFIKGYKFTKGTGQVEFLPAEDVVHFRMPTPLQDYYGTSPIKTAQTRIQTEEFASTYQRDFFLNNARPDAMLKFPNALHKNRKDEIKEEWEDRHKGRGKNSKIAILEQGLEYQQISISQKEMDFIESMKFTRDDILVAFSVPKPVVAIVDDVNLANSQTAMFIFLSETIKPLMEMLNEQMNEMLIAPDFGENLFLDFIDPTPQNRDQIVKEYDSGLMHNWLLINEVRMRENLPPVDGGWDFYLPISSVPVGGLGQGNKSFVKIAGLSREEIISKRAEIQKEKNRIDKSKKMRVFRGKQFLYQRLVIAEKFIAELKRKDELPTDETDKELKPLINAELRNDYAKMILKAVDLRAANLKKKLVEKTKSQSDSLIARLSQQDLTKAIGPDTKKTIKEFFEKENTVMAEFVFPFIEEYVRLAGQDAMSMVNPDKTFDMTERIRAVVTKRAKEFGLGVNKTTRDKVSAAITAGLEAGEGMTQISDRISEVYKEFPTYRADLIARTESTAANNEGFMEAYKQSDVASHKEWIATIDDRTRDEHLALDGETVAVSKNFSNGLPYPQEPNCRCVIAPAFEE